MLQKNSGSRKPPKLRSASASTHSPTAFPPNLPVLPGEDQTNFDQHLERLSNSWMPQDEQEKDLVRNHQPPNQWKLARLVATHRIHLTPGARHLPHHRRPRTLPQRARGPPGKHWASARTISSDRASSGAIAKATDTLKCSPRSWAWTVNGANFSPVQAQFATRPSNDPLSLGNRNSTD